MCVGPLHPESKIPIFKFNEQCSLHFRPEFDATFAWDCTHMFSGSFCGWHQAVEWIPNAGIGFLPGRQIFIDNDDVTMGVCATQNQMKVVKCPLDPLAPWSPTSKLGVIGDIADQTIPHVHRSQLNLLCTLSPPCQTWSRGGKAGGLSETNGWSFIEGLKQIFVLQPILAFAECADEIRKHCHFPIVQHVASVFGYKTLWTQVMPFHELSHHHRTRWLCIWIRFDIPAQPLGFELPCSITPRLAWNDECYQFTLPSVWKHQVSLSASEAKIYNDPALLPPAKRARLRPDPQHDVSHFSILLISVHSSVPCPALSCPASCHSL